MFDYIYSMTILKQALLIGLIAAAMAADCGPGALSYPNGTCFSPVYIEGCFTYASPQACLDCEYNYVKSGSICSYTPPTDNSDCCSVFTQSGECSQCASGLSLFEGKCLDKKIIGCLQKSKTGSCLVCSNAFTLFGGQCIKKTDNCIKYSSSGVCEVCESNFEQAKGYCMPKNMVLSENICTYPWTLTTEKKCEVVGCAFYFEFGCVKCQAGFRLLPDGSCKRGEIEGCQSYAPDGYCEVCRKPVYEKSAGFCVPFGCSRINNEGKCIQCAINLGFQMSADGYCRIPNCLVTNEKQCLVCSAGFVETPKGCVPEGVQKVCVTCARGFFLTENKDCQPKQPGCLAYNRFRCSECEPGLYLTQNFKCEKKDPGCIYKSGICSDCIAPFRWIPSQQKCAIEGCIEFLETGCKKCSSPYILTLNGLCTFENCIQVNGGRCLSCIDGYSISNDGYCFKVDPFCKAYSLDGRCIECKLGYYFEKIGKELVCKEEKFGCNYIDGRCVSCRAPFDYNPKEQSCEIDGCLKYFLGGCTTCSAGYSLRYNSCKLPYCLISNKGHCVECDPNYVLKSDGTCVNKDEFCWKYDAAGNCLECAPQYYYSKLTKKCKPREPGCLYNDNDECFQCEKPFYFDGTRCEIYGCLKLNSNGCEQCLYPMERTNNGLCAVVNCDRMEGDKCLVCKAGFTLKGCACVKEDPKCMVYGDRGCKKCIKGYKMDKNGICEYADEHCWDFTEDGICSNCDRMYFLNAHNKCEIKDSNCDAYSNGRCVKCSNFYYLFRGLCFANSKGCVKQKNIKECLECETGYNLNYGYCAPDVTRLNYDSVQMDFWEGSTDEIKAEAKQIFSIGVTDKKSLEPALAKGMGKIIYSSIAPGKRVFQVDDFSEDNGWSPVTSNPGEFIGVVLNNMQIMYAVDIKFVKGSTLKRFVIEESDDGVSFTKVNEFVIAKGIIDSVETFYFTPVQSKVIRLVVLEGSANIKIQFYYSNGENFKNNSKPTTYIQEQTQLAIEEEVDQEFFKVKEGCVNKELCWMGVEFCSAKEIKGFTLTPNNSSKGAIEAVTVRYSVDGVKFVCYNECKEIALKSNSVILNPRVQAMKMRIHPAKWTGEPSYSVTFDY